MLLDLKGQYKTLTGRDFKPANSGKKEKKKGETKNAGKGAKSKKKEEQKPSQDEREVKKLTR